MLGHRLYCYCCYLLHDFVIIFVSQSYVNCFLVVFVLTLLHQFLVMPLCLIQVNQYNQIYYSHFSI